MARKSDKAIPFQLFQKGSEFIFRTIKDEEDPAARIVFSTQKNNTPVNFNAAQTDLCILINTKLGVQTKEQPKNWHPFESALLMLWKQAEKIAQMDLPTSYFRFQSPKGNDALLIPLSVLNSSLCGKVFFNGVLCCSPFGKHYCPPFAIQITDKFLLDRDRQIKDYWDFCDNTLVPIVAEALESDSVGDFLAPSILKFIFDHQQSMIENYQPLGTLPTRIGIKGKVCLAKHYRSLCGSIRIISSSQFKTKQPEFYIDLQFLKSVPDTLYKLITTDVEEGIVKDNTLFCTWESVEQQSKRDLRNSKSYEPSYLQELRVILFHLNIDPQIIEMRDTTRFDCVPIYLYESNKIILSHRATPENNQIQTAVHWILDCVQKNKIDCQQTKENLNKRNRHDTTETKSLQTGMTSVIITQQTEDDSKKRKQEETKETKLKQTKLINTESSSSAPKTYQFIETLLSSADKCQIWKEVSLQVHSVETLNQVTKIATLDFYHEQNQTLPTLSTESLLVLLQFDNLAKKFTETIKSRWEKTCKLQLYFLPRIPLSFLRDDTIYINVAPVLGKNTNQEVATNFFRVLFAHESAHLILSSQSHDIDHANLEQLILISLIHSLTTVC